MLTEDVLRQIDSLAENPQQRKNALALLSSLGANIPEDVSRNPYTGGISLHWQAQGNWNYVEVEIYDHGFETYLSRDKETCIKHWPNDLGQNAIGELVGELLRGMA